MADTQSAAEKAVEKSRERVDTLREQVAEEEAALRSSEATRHLQVDKATLDAEGDRLEAELARLKEARQVSEKPVSEDPVMRQIELGGEAATIAAQEVAADAAAAEAKAKEGDS